MCGLILVLMVSWLVSGCFGDLCGVCWIGICIGIVCVVVVFDIGGIDVDVFLIWEFY